MTPLIWSEDKPTVRGFYFRRGRDISDDVVSIYPYEGEMKCVIEGWHHDLSDINHCQWSGPIPLPIEPDLPHYIDRAVSTDLNERVKQ